MVFSPLAYAAIVVLCDRRRIRTVSMSDCLGICPSVRDGRAFEKRPAGCSTDRPASKRLKPRRSCIWWRELCLTTYPGNDRAHVPHRPEKKTLPNASAGRARQGGFFRFPSRV